MDKKRILKSNLILLSVASVFAMLVPSVVQGQTPAVPSDGGAVYESSGPILRSSVIDSTKTTTKTTSKSHTKTVTNNSSGTTTVIKKEASTVSFDIKPDRIRRDGRTAMKMAHYHWLDKVVEGNPAVLEAIVSHRSAALALTKHPRLAQIAETDHYLCRRLTVWRSVSLSLAQNPEAYRVIVLDPEGIYRAIKRDRRVARTLAKNPNFDEMVTDNPDLGRMIALYI
jgi:hypothetical protein